MTKHKINEEDHRKVVLYFYANEDNRDWVIAKHFGFKESYVSSILEHEMSKKANYYIKGG